jgi:hypothetical protein
LMIAVCLRLRILQDTSSSVHRKRMKKPPSQNILASVTSPTLLGCDKRNHRDIVLRTTAPEPVHQFNLHAKFRWPYFRRHITPHAHARPASQCRKRLRGNRLGCQSRWACCSGWLRYSKSRIDEQGLRIGQQPLHRFERSGRSFGETTSHLTKLQQAAASDWLQLREPHDLPLCQFRPAFGWKRIA